VREGDGMLTQSLVQLNCQSAGCLPAII
jgi:hypothetical protein